MGGFISAFSARFIYNKNIKILCLGLDAAGKTTFIYKLKLGELANSRPSGLTLEITDNKSTALLTWDQGGRTGVRALRNHFYVGVQGIFFVVDSSDRERMSEAKKELQSILEASNLKDAVLVVIANKQDLPNAMPVSEICDQLNLHSLKERKWFIQAACATSGDGIYEGVDFLVASLMSKEFSK